MAIGAFLPIIAFVLIAGGVGFRLTALWRRTGGVAEGSLGSGLVLVTLSMPLYAFGRAPATATSPFGRSAFAVALVLSALGIALVGYFHRHVFCPRARWAGALYAITCMLLAGSISWMGATNFRGEDVLAIKDETRPGTLVLMGAIMGVFVWGAIESFLCLSTARRRLAIGLGDAIVVDRFRLWGIASVACAALLAVLITCALSGMVVGREPIPLVAIASCGAIMSACWSLTFFTPARYRSYVEARASR